MVCSFFLLQAAYPLDSIICDHITTSASPCRLLFIENRTQSILGSQFFLSVGWELSMYARIWLLASLPSRSFAPWRSSYCRLPRTKVPAGSSPPLFPRCGEKHNAYLWTCLDDHVGAPKSMALLQQFKFARSKAPFRLGYSPLQALVTGVFHIHTTALATDYAYCNNWSQILQSQGVAVTNSTALRNCASSRCGWKALLVYFSLKLTSTQQIRTQIHSLLTHTTTTQL
jgi:hypothetical protein